jgi:hypothetical protein
MGAYEISRRRAVAALAVGAAPALAAATALPANQTQDAELLATWELRQRTLAQIEQRGPFRASEWHSPKETKIFDDAEVRIVASPALTPRGVLAKLWVAFSYVGDVHSEEDHIVHGAIRRADIDDVRPFMDDADFELEAVFKTIEALTAIVERAA